MSAVLFLGNFSEKLPFFQKVRLYKKRPTCKGTTKNNNLACFELLLPEAPPCTSC